MWGRRTIWAAIALVAGGCTILFPFEAPDEGSAAGCGACSFLCRCVFGDGHEPITAVNARPADGEDCCAVIHGDFNRSPRADWFVFHVRQGENLVVNPCSQSSDLHLEVRLYADWQGSTEIDRERADGVDCANSLTNVASADGERAIQVLDVSGSQGEYTVTVSFGE